MIEERIGRRGISTLGHLDCEQVDAQCMHGAHGKCFLSALG